MNLSPVENARLAANRLAGMFARASELDRSRPTSSGDTVREPTLPFARALLKMKILPALVDGWAERDPVQLVMLGTTNAGKSTVLNIFAGCPAAGMNVTARFTQHPEAYVPAAVGTAWLDQSPSRFQGAQRYEQAHPPWQSLTDLRQHGYRRAYAVIDPDRLGVERHLASIAGAAVLWDAPDFSTEEAQLFWMETLLETLALADVVVWCVTQESYADHRGLLLWKMASAAGLTLHLVANKLPRLPQLYDDIRRKYEEHSAAAADRYGDDRLARLPAVEGNSTEEILARILLTPEAHELRRRVAADLADRSSVKQASLAGAAKWLGDRFDDLVRPLAQEAELAVRWREKADALAASVLVDRYRREYLEGNRYVEFNQAIIQLLKLIEVPGVGQVLEYVRAPVRWLGQGIRSLWQQWQGGPPKLPAEEEKLFELADRFRAELRSEAQSLAADTHHPAWHRLAGDLANDDAWRPLREKLAGGYREYRQAVDEEIGRRAWKMYEELQQNPTMLNTLRAIKFTADSASISLALVYGGINIWDFLIVPAAAGGVQQATELWFQKEAGRERLLLQEFQMGAMRKLLDTSLVEPAARLLIAEIRMEEIEALAGDLAAVQTGVAAVLEGLR